MSTITDARGMQYYGTRWMLTEANDRLARLAHNLWSEQQLSLPEHNKIIINLHRIAKGYPPMRLPVPVW